MRFTRFNLSMMPPIWPYLLLVTLLVVFPITTKAATITLFVPLTGEYSELGKNFRLGAELAMSELGQDHQLQILDEGCDAKLVKSQLKTDMSADTAIVGGFLCNDTATSAASELSAKNIPLIVSSARSVRLIKDREREQWNLWRLAPGDDFPVKKAADAIERLWRDKSYAIVDDGSVYGRNYTDTLRLLLNEKGMNPPVSETFRTAKSSQEALLRRLQRSGISAMFVASASTDDLVTIVQNLSDLNIPIELMASEALMVIPYLNEAEQIPSGVMVVGWPEQDDDYVAPKLASAGIAPDRMFYTGYSTVQIALSAMGSSRELTTENLSSQTFETIVGPIRFLPNGASEFNPYQLMKWNGKTMVSITTKPNIQ